MGLTCEESHVLTQLCQLANRPRSPMRPDERCFVLGLAANSRFTLSRKQTLWLWDLAIKYDVKPMRGDD